MTPKEIQEKLNISADRIKLYKREGIFSPQNSIPGKRADYTEVDLENLRLLIVLTKLGFTCGDIKKIQNGEKTLQEVGVSRKKAIESDIKMKQSSLSLLSDLVDSNADLNSLDTMYYFNLISSKEASGETFMDIDNFSISLIRNIKCTNCNIKSEVDLEDYVYADSSYEKENGMGPDIVYDFDSESNYECPNCHKILRIHGWIREYPEGCYDSEDINVEMLDN